MLQNRRYKLLDAQVFLVGFFSWHLIYILFGSAFLLPYSKRKGRPSHRIRVLVPRNTKNSSSNLEQHKPLLEKESRQETKEPFFDFNPG